MSMSEGLQSPLASPVRQSVSETEAAQRVQPTAHRSTDQGTRDDPRKRDAAGDGSSSGESVPAPVLIEDQIVLSEAARQAAGLQMHEARPPTAVDASQDKDKDQERSVGPSIHFKV